MTDTRITKTGRIIAALAARADKECTPLDFVKDWIGSGQSLLALADSLTASMGEPVRRDALSRLVYTLEGARNRLPEARRRGADALVDQAAKLLDEAPTDSREALAKTAMNFGLLQAMLPTQIMAAGYGGPTGQTQTQQPNLWNAALGIGSLAATALA